MWDFDWFLQLIYQPKTGILILYGIAFSLTICMFLIQKKHFLHLYPTICVVQNLIMEIMMLYEIVSSANTYFIYSVDAIYYMNNFQFVIFINISYAFNNVHLHFTIKNILFFALTKLNQPYIHCIPIN